MKTGQTPIFVAALLLFLPAGGAYLYMQNKEEKAPLETPTTSTIPTKKHPSLDELSHRLNTTGVLAAAAAIPANTKIEPQHLTFVRLPDKKVPRGSVSDQKLLIGKIASRSFSEGQILIRKDFTDEPIESSHPLVPSGYRSLVVYVDQSESRLASWVTPGTRVDLRVKIQEGLGLKGPRKIEQASANAVILSFGKDVATKNENRMSFASQGTPVHLAIRAEDMSGTKKLLEKGKARIFRRGSQMIL